MSVRRVAGTFIARLLHRGDCPGIRGTFRYLQENSAAGAGLARSSRVVARSSSLGRLSGQRRSSRTGPAAHAHRIQAGRSPEQAPVLPAELGRTAVPDAEADAGEAVRRALDGPDAGAPAAPPGRDWPIALCTGRYEPSPPGMTIASMQSPNEHGQNTKER